MCTGDLFQYIEIIPPHTLYLILAKRGHKNSPLFSKFRMLPLIPWWRGSTFLAIVTSGEHMQWRKSVATSGHR